MAKKQLTICGLNSVRAVADHTPGTIERLFFDENAAPFFSAACRHLAREHKTYRLVSADELRKITDSTHHQGAAAVIEEATALPLAALKPQTHLLCLHNVLNPHNIGAILRTAAFFGVDCVIVSGTTFAAAQTQAAWRVAEGGLTHVKLYSYNDARDLFSWAGTNSLRALAAVKPGAKSPRSLGEFLRDRNRGQVVVCLGNEEEGLDAAFVGGCAGRFSFTGTGKIESLNVSVAAALCLAEIRENVSRKER